MRKLTRPLWHNPGHRLWDDFCNAMVPAVLTEDDWMQYQEAHDLEELPEVESAVGEVAKLLVPPTEPLPGPLKKKKAKRPPWIRRPKRA